jgi:dephospho-CoA kinase
MKRMVIGITGGIGAGKSAVTDYLRRLGEYVICADEVAREVVQPGSEGANAIRAEFGEEYFLPDGALDRAKLSGFVFENPERLKRLNGILHPRIISAVWDKAEKREGRVFVDAPLLIETGMYEKADFVWVVTADRETRIRRVMRRDGVDRDAVEKRMENQTDDAHRIRYADEVIDNSNGLQELHRKIDHLLQKYQNCEGLHEEKKA